MCHLWVHMYVSKLLNQKMIITKFRIVVAKLLVMFYVLKLLFIILFLSFFNLYRLLYIVLCYLFTIPKELFKNWAHRDGESELMGRCGRWEKRGTHQLNQGYCSRPNLGGFSQGQQMGVKRKGPETPIHQSSHHLQRGSVALSPPPEPWNPSLLSAACRDLSWPWPAEHAEAWCLCSPCGAISRGI